MNSSKTSWGNVAGWYDNLLKDKDSYQSQVILPNLLRLVSPKVGENIADIACGQGFFSKAFSDVGAKVIGADVSSELVNLAVKNVPKAEFKIAPADKLVFAKENSFDKAVIVLAIQNIENLNGVFLECSRILKNTGELFIVMNHPAFRIPKESAWGIDEEKSVQYRRIDKYISESRALIEMHPGIDKRETTVSFHRPLQVYFKALEKAGFAVSRLEEWMSHKKSEAGPKKNIEDRARKEIPLFLFLQAKKIVN